MRILLLGAGGQVGTELRRSFAEHASHQVVYATRDGSLPNAEGCEVADLAKPETLPAVVARIEPDVVINAAAYTAVDRAEDEPELAFTVNAQAPRVLAEACAARDAWLLHYSTDYVFDGTATRPYREDDPTAPLGVYGASKLAGEQAIEQGDCRHMILRTAWVYALHGHNFLRTMLRLATEREELRVVADQIGTPTPASLIADVTARVLDNGLKNSGRWHLTATGQTSWHGFAEAIFEQAHAGGLIAKLPRVLPITTADYPTRAARPPWSVLDTARLRQEFGVALPDWREVLPGVLAAAR